MLRTRVCWRGGAHVGTVDKMSICGGVEMTVQDPSAPISVDQALLDPSSVFTCPEDVLSRSDLTREQKAEILRRWEYDASEIAVAEEEGMMGVEDDLLRQILLALEKLGRGIDVERTSPTKQHGIA